MKYLPLIVILQFSTVFSQDLQLTNPIKSNRFSIGLEANLIAEVKAYPRYCSIRKGNYNSESEINDASNSSLYSINAGYETNKVFARLSLGVGIDNINIEQKGVAHSGSNGGLSGYYSQSTTRTNTYVVDQSRSYVAGAEFGAFINTKMPRIKFGVSVGLGYTSYYSTRVIRNEIITSYSSSGVNQNGSYSNSSSTTDDNQSWVWSNNVTKNNRPLFSQKLSLYGQFRILNQLAIELNAGFRFITVTKRSQTYLQFPMGVGLRYYIF